MKIMDMLISSVIKKGVLYEARNCDLEFDIPMNQLSGNEEAKGGTIKVRMKVEHMSLKLEKE